MSIETEQMSAYSDMLNAFDNAAKLLTSIHEILLLADFTNQPQIQSLYNGIYGTNKAIESLTKGFKAYAESHELEITNPIIG